MARLINNRWAELALVTGLIVLAGLLLPSNYYFRVGALVLISAIAAVGLNLLLGFAGQVSLGHAGFVGIGAYAVALLPTHWGVPTLASIFLGAAFSGVLALAIGRPILRLKGHFLAVATLGLGILVAMVLTNEARITGGPDGMPVPRLELLGTRIRAPEAWYWIAGGTLIISIVFAQNLLNSSTGRALRALHDSEVAARAAGINVARVKGIVFSISAVYASISGSLLALLNGHITPDTASFLNSIELVTMVVLGGMGSLVGSLVGAAVLVILPQALTVFHEYEHLLLGSFIIAIMIFLRDGIVPTLRKALLERKAPEDRV
ncbi:MAG: branched-chain amino acid transport system permease [Beijerinckiaceae bacterium]|nr:MAG: branched-chain amino acid transport system permease [Beijerinckiaceae bacterium]